MIGSDSMSFPSSDFRTNEGVDPFSETLAQNPFKLRAFLVGAIDHAWHHTLCAVLVVLIDVFCPAPSAQCAENASACKVV